MKRIVLGGQSGDSTVLSLIAIVIVILSLFTGIFVDKAIAVRALEKQGYSDIRITNKDWFMVGLRGCSGHDAAKFTASVVNPAGKEVEVFVCTGFIFKGATIRTD